MGLDLELVGLAFLPGLLLVADFDKDELAELAKGGRRRKTASAPKRIVAFLDGCDQILPGDGLNVGTIFFFPSTSVYTPPL